MSRDAAEKAGFKYWFIFGSSAGGKVDISDGDRDVFTSVDRAEATRAIEDRDRLMLALCEALERNDDRR